MGVDVCGGAALGVAELPRHDDERHTVGNHKRCISVLPIVAEPRTALLRLPHGQ